MIDPSDVEIQAYRDGTAQTGEYPYGGPGGEPSPGDQSSERVKIPMAIILSQTFIAGAEAKIDANDKPDYWSIGLVNDANARIVVWPYPTPSGPGVTLAPNDKVKLPGLNQEIYIRSTGSATATVNVIAMRGWSAELGMGF